MEATSKCRRYRKGVLSATSTSMHGCYASKNISSSQPNGEAKVTCRCCKEECHCLMPSRTNSHFSNSTLGPPSSKKECGICRPVKQFGSKLLKLGDLGGSNKDRNLLSGSLSPSMPYSSALPSTSRYNKRAVLCGVSYKRMKFRLRGTMNDIRNMKELLIKNFDFPNECIRILTGISICFCQKQIAVHLMDLTYSVNLYLSTLY
ncbi:unnamed protein product [Sphenostylis stenocarpa]|uniref:Uncharacterized protein n=1 Tax=Sphenostylis stenocarpa TaxID=92480 RepID=A0AA86VB62_9FABA|nr:unnamed protein product [Sphenostylis stenocarpa]